VKKLILPTISHGKILFAIMLTEDFLSAVATQPHSTRVISSDNDITKF